jgi:hypothetical protein
MLSFPHWLTKKANQCIHGTGYRPPVMLLFDTSTVSPVGVTFTVQIGFHNITLLGNPRRTG